MNSIRISVRRAGSLFAVAALVLSSAVPGLASAATVTERSIEMSSSVKSAEGVSYHIQFKTDEEATTTGAFALDFCDSPAVGAACTPPAGLSTEDIVTSSGGNTFAATNTNTGVKVTLGTPVSAEGTVNVTVSGIVNPSATGPFYARIVTYTDGTTGYNYTNPASLGAYLDSGSVALSIVDGFDVSGVVAETMTFCASGDEIAEADCSDADGNPNVSLGTNGVLDTSLSEGVVYTQISTNAAGGAVVNLKSNTEGCGGLARAGAATFADGCGIAPAIGDGGTAVAIGSGDALFGLRLVGLAAETGSVVAASPYEDTDFYMDYVAGDATGVTSPYGSPVFDTDGAPVDQGKANLTFGANISSVTPAGRYSASLSLIATGKF